jgi:hypothetical protein
MSRYNPKDTYYYDHQEGDPLRLSIAELKAFMKRWPRVQSFQEEDYLEIFFGLSVEEWGEIQRSKERDVRLEYAGAYVDFLQVGKAELDEDNYIAFGYRRDGGDSFGVADDSISLYLPPDRNVEEVNLKTLCAKFQETEIGKVKINCLSLIRYTNQTSSFGELTKTSGDPVFTPGVLCPIW